MAGKASDSGGEFESELADRFAVLKHTAVMGRRQPHQLKCQPGVPYVPGLNIKPADDAEG